MERYYLSKNHSEEIPQNVSLPKIGYYGKPLCWDDENAQVGNWYYL